MNISKRKMESYRRAELVCRELRFQIGGKFAHQDLERAVDLLTYWMDKTGKIKYERPEPKVSKLKKKMLAMVEEVENETL